MNHIKSLLRKDVNIEELYQTILQQIDDLVKFAQNDELLRFNNEKVSKWNLKDHLEHLSITGRSTIRMIELALENKIRLSKNKDGKKLFELGFFPRGKTQSPEFAIPKGADSKKIVKNFMRYVTQLKGLSEHFLKKKHLTGTSEHPLIGHLTVTEWLQFIAMHQEHHLNFVKELQLGSFKNT